MAIPQRILFFIGFLLTMVGCSKNEVPEPTPTPNTSSKRVIMAYMVANNNLDEDIMNNVEWMYQGLSEVKDTCTLLIYYKGKSSNTYKYIYQEAGDSEIPDRRKRENKRRTYSYGEQLDKKKHFQSSGSNRSRKRNIYRPGCYESQL